MVKLDREKLVGIKNNKLTLVKYLGKFGKSKMDWWVVVCECGNTKKTTFKSFKTGSIKSCGCTRRKGLKKFKSKFRVGMIGKNERD